MSSLMFPPIALYSGPKSLVFNAGNADTLDPQVMQNPSRRAMLIDEVRFTLLGLSAQSPIIGGALNWAGVLSTRLRVNRQNITKGYVPIWVLSKQVNNGECGFDTDFATPIGAPTFVYRPPCPIYVPRYCNLQCDLLVDPKALAVYATINGQTIWYGITYNGREVPDDVELSVVSTPFVGTYLPDAFPAATKQTKPVRSTQNDLVSPFVEPMSVKALIGRVLVGAAGGLAGGDANNVNASLFEDITVRMMHSNGAIVARDYVPTLLMFDGITRAWEMDATLDRNEYLIASIDADLTNQAAPAMVQIAMHGFRDVPASHY